METKPNKKLSKQLKEIAFLLLTLLFFAFLLSGGQHNATINAKVNALCAENPNKSCQAIYDYCYRALKSGNECYL